MTIPHTAPGFITSRRVATVAAAIAAATIVARELVFLEPGQFPLHHGIALAAGVVAPIVLGVTVFRRLGVWASVGVAIACGHTIPLAAFLVLNLALYGEGTWFQITARVIGHVPFHLAASLFAITGALVFGIGASNASRCDGVDRGAVYCGSLLVAIGVVAGVRLFTYAGGAPPPTGAWVLAACVAVSVGSGVGAIAVGALRRRALRAFVRRVDADDVAEWRIRPETVDDVELSLTALDARSADHRILERRVCGGGDPYRAADHYAPVARVP
jgi:hypothetical protein